MILFLKGLAVGFAIAAPVGPIGLLCIHRTLTGGRLAGFVAGLGAAAADTVYGAIAAFGLTLVGRFLVDQQIWLALIAGPFLCWLGFVAWRAEPATIEATPNVRTTDLAGGFGSTFLLTLANPMTIFSFVGVFAGLGLASEPGEGRDGAAAAQLILGVFLGSAAWWLLLSGGVGLIRHRLSRATLRWINRASGAVIVAAGLFALSRAFA